MVSFGARFWKDYDLECEVRKSNGDGCVRIFFRAAPVKKYELSLGTKQGHLLSYIAGSEPHTIRSMYGSLTTGEWYKVRISARDARIRCYVNQRKLFEIDDRRAPDGPVGLGFWDASGRYRNIKVTGPDGKALW